MLTALLQVSLIKTHEVAWDLTIACAVSTLVLHLQDHSVKWITPMNAESHASLQPAHVVTNGFDPLRDVGHSYAQLLQKDGTTVTYVHHEDMTHAFVQFGEKS